MSTYHSPVEVLNLAVLALRDHVMDSTLIEPPPKKTKKKTIQTFMFRSEEQDINGPW